MLKLDQIRPPQTGMCVKKERLRKGMQVSMYAQIIKKSFICFFLNIIKFYLPLELTIKEVPEIMLHARIPGSAFTTVSTL